MVCDLSAKVAGDFPGFQSSFQGIPAAPWLYVSGQPATLACRPNLTATNGGRAGFSMAVVTGDAGAFYTGRDWTSQGNVLRHNYVHDLGGGDAGHVNTMGMCFDDCDCGDPFAGTCSWIAPNKSAISTAT